MKIIVLGQGGREHAILRALADSTGTDSHDLFVHPGSDAMTSLATRVDVPDQDALVAWMQDAKIDLCVVGEERFLAAGITDACEAVGIRAWGPKKFAAQLESSKAFAKDFMQRHSIPTAGCLVAENEAELRAGITQLPTVLKYNGLAAGKGVAVCTDQAMVDEFCDMVYTQNRFGKDTVLVEDFLEGPEVSVICAVAGGDFMAFPCARDYKRLEDGDGGPNTGGMGAVASTELVDPALMAEINETILAPCIAGLVADSMDYHGFLYVGLMLTPNGPKVLEFNCRFGDPEAEAILPMIGGDFASFLFDAAASDLQPKHLSVASGWSVCLVLASKDYPAKSGQGDVITGLDEVDSGFVYHSGTRKNAAGEFETNGGRVLCVVHAGATRAEAVDAVYAQMKKVQFDGAQTRSDIGVFNFA